MSIATGRHIIGHDKINPWYFVMVEFVLAFPIMLMMRTALNTIDAHSEESYIVGVRMNTDIAAGTESGLHTILGLTGVTRREEAERFPYRPTRIVQSVAEIMP